MKSDWPEVPFPEVIDFREGPGIMARDFRDEGVPLIRVAGLSGASSVLRGCNYLDREIVEAKWSHFRVAPGDTLLSTSASLGRVAVVAEEAEGAIPYTGIIRMRPADTRVLSSFIPHLLSGPHFQRQAEAVGSGSVLRHFGPSHLRTMTVVLPPVDEQQRISWVLDSLGDKIENNRRIAEILEQIAATLFTARFVDFVDHDDLVDSELGPIPRSWSVRPLGEVGVVHRDITKGPTDLAYIGLDAMPRGSTVLSTWTTGEDAPNGGARFMAGDILFGKLRPYFRKVGVAPIQGRCSTEILVLRPINPAYYGFLLGHVSSQQFIDHCAAVSRGTRMPRAEWTDAGTYKVAVPPAELAEDFSALVRSFYSKIGTLTHQTQTLGAIRDSLLPRLISGQLAVSEAEDLTAETV